MSKAKDKAVADGVRINLWKQEGAWWSSPATQRVYVRRADPEWIAPIGEHLKKKPRTAPLVLFERWPSGLESRAMIEWSDEVFFANGWWPHTADAPMPKSVATRRAA